MREEIGKNKHEYFRTLSAWWLALVSLSIIMYLWLGIDGAVDITSKYV